MKTLIILTEEVPNIDEIICMLSVANFPVQNDMILQADITDNTFHGKWIIQTEQYIINIHLFKGKTSSVDYLLFDKPFEEIKYGDASQALVALESTKTNDSNSGSRNTSVYQRITKFTTFMRMYPNSNTKFVMFWTNTNWKTTITQTAMFGFKMMITLGIQLYYSFDDQQNINLQTKYNITKFDTTDELLSYKNSMKHKEGNTTIRIVQTLAGFHITIKLDKGDGNHAGKISHDPNVGFLSALLNSIQILETNTSSSPLKFYIEKHGVKQNYFDKKPSSKLWHSIHGIDIEFENCEIKERPQLPTKYFTIEKEMTEKLATIICDLTSYMRTIFSNHGGCALTDIKGPENELHKVGQKMHRPDIVFENKETQEILIVEGKIEKDIHKGVLQLEDTYINDFIVLLKKIYPSHKICKGLCITIKNIDDMASYKDLMYPVKFAIDTNGKFIDLR